MLPRGPPPSPPREEASTLSAGAVGKNRLGDLSQPSATPHSAGKAGDRGEESPGAGEIQAETAQEKPAAAEVGALPGSSARKPGILCFQFNVNICRSIHSPIYHSHIHAFPRPSIPHPRVHRPFILHPSSNILDQPSSIVIHPSTHPSFNKAIPPSAHQSSHTKAINRIATQHHLSGGARFCPGPSRVQIATEPLRLEDCLCPV